MPHDEFVEIFLPVSEGEWKGQLSAHNAFKAVPSCATDPAAIYKPLTRSLNRRTKLKSRCPGFVFDNSIERSIRPSRLGYTKPHICCYAADNIATVRRSGHDTRIEFGYAELFIEVKTDPSADYFTDPPADADEAQLAAHDFVTGFPTEELGDQAARMWGQHIAFATKIFARQYRQALFSITMSGSVARLIRWDRAGCVVSSAFDIHDEPEVLTAFLWRFSQTTHVVRGHDLSVHIATAAEEVLFKEAIRNHVTQQLEIEGEDLDKAVAAHYQPGHVAAMHVLYEASSSPAANNLRRYIVSRPIVSPLSLDGRATSGYWAIDADTAQIVFLKDVWRGYSRKELEGDLLERLNLLGVQNVPALVSHGYVPDHIPEGVRHVHRCALQITQTDQIAQSEWVCLINEKTVRVNQREHYRLVITPVGYGLSTVRGTEELLHATYDVFLAMRDAFTKDFRLHRDISVGNIILVREPSNAIRKGYLIDWDASDSVDDTGEAQHPGRAGTWAFMSIRMLDGRSLNRKHSFQDDMESLLYVVLYCGLHYLPHNLSKLSLTAMVRALFGKPTDTAHGGDAKFTNSAFRQCTRRVQFGSAALQEWLTTVMDYHSPPEALREAYADKWSNPDHLDAFWTEFLRTRTLERADRVEHTISMTGFYDVDSVTTSTHRSVHTSSPAKRPSDEPAHASAPPAKRARSSAADCSAPVGIRRSERIREQAHRPQKEAPLAARRTRTARPAASTQRQARGRSSTTSRR
ncbi:hypothetical protein BD413DRAFT_470915 [Trametes elegans]|nr:hypothetical protein BD413DRAFT_470915 [Trametes elegans]